MQPISGDPALYDAIDHAEPLAGHPPPELAARVDPTARHAPRSPEAWNGATSFDHACALVIGISKYEHIASLPAVRDAQDVAEALTRHGGYAPGNVRKLIDESATRAAIVAELEVLAGRDPRPPLLLFYFSGHGGARREATGTDRDCYLMPFDGRWNAADAVAELALSGAELATLVEKVGAERVIVILDCCHAESGTVTKDVVFPLERRLQLGRLHDGGRGRVVLAASSGDGEAFVRAGDRNGVFTGHLLAALRGACGGHDGVIDVVHLYEYVQRKVAQEPEVQESQFLSAIAGEMFAIARLPDPPLLPPDTARPPSDRRPSERPPIDQGPPPEPRAVDRRALQRALLNQLSRIEEHEPMIPSALGNIPADEVGRAGWRRVPSLQRALLESRESVTVIEGGPGTGKSAFLQGFAARLADPDAPQQRTAGSSALPLYVNLRDLEVPRGRPIDAHLIETFVVETWAASVPDLRATLRREGSWLVLLDSFDEIPELLSSNGSEALVTQYAEAIEAFADHSVGCRVIVATRPHHGPKRTSWTRYRLLPLGPERRREIAAEPFHRAGKGDDVIERFLGELDASRLPGWRDSPLILNLICEHAADRDALPDSLHDAFESFVERRVAARRDVLDRRRVTKDQLRRVAERVAFCMTARARVGRAIDVQELLSALPGCGLEASSVVCSALDALVELRLARGSVAPGVERDRFAFAHRQFQEYFTACCVCGGMVVAPVTLLTDRRWSEVAITVLQAGSPARVGPVLAHAADLLEQAVAALPACGRVEALPRSPVELEKARQARSVGAFCWPERSRCVLRIVSSLVAAWGPVEEEHGDSARRVRRAADALLMACVLGGVRIDHATAVELSGAATDPMRELVLAWACSVRSEWLEDLAITQAAAHSPLPLPVEHAVRRMVLRRALSGELRAERVRTEARLRRVDQSGALVHTARWLLAAAPVDLVGWGPLAGVFALRVPQGMPWWYGLLGLVVATICWLGTPRLLQWHTGRVDRVLVPRLRIGLTTSLVVSATPTITFRTIGAVFLLSPLATDGSWSVETIIVVAVLLGTLRPFVYAAAGERHFGTAAWWRAVLDVGWKLGVVMLVFFPAVLTLYLAVLTLGIVALIVPFTTGGSVLLVVVAAAYLVLVGRLLVRARRSLLDFLLDRRRRRHRSSIGAEQLLLDASGYRSERARLGFLRRVREDGLFQPGPNCERMLRDAILAIERDRKVPWFRPRGTDPRWSERFATLYQTDLATCRGMARWFGGPLDELSSLLTHTVFPDRVAAESSSTWVAAKL